MGIQHLDAVGLAIAAPFLDQFGFLVGATIGLLEFKGRDHDATEVVNATLKQQIDPEVGQADHPSACFYLLRGHLVAAVIPFGAVPAGGASTVKDAEIPDDPFLMASPVPDGGRVRITGTKPPCGPCQAQMRLSVEDTASTFEYLWPDGNGGMNVFATDG